MPLIQLKCRMAWRCHPQILHAWQSCGRASSCVAYLVSYIGVDAWRRQVQRSVARGVAVLDVPSLCGYGVDIMEGKVVKLAARQEEDAHIEQCTAIEAEVRALLQDEEGVLAPLGLHCSAGGTLRTLLSGPLQWASLQPEP